MGDRILCFGNHFVQRWGERVEGCPFPDIEAVQKLIDESIKLRSHQVLYVKVAGRFREHEVLAEYWHPEAKLIFKVNSRNGKVVTVLSPKCRNRKAEGGERRAE